MMNELTAWQKMKLVYAALTGDGFALAKMAVAWFNDRILSRIGDPDEVGCYCQDIKDFCVFLRVVLSRHRKWMSDEQRDAWLAVLAAAEAISTVLENGRVDPDELGSVVEHLRTVLDILKKAMKK